MSANRVRWRFDCSCRNATKKPALDNCKGWRHAERSIVDCSACVSGRVPPSPARHTRATRQTVRAQRMYLGRKEPSQHCVIYTTNELQCQINNPFIFSVRRHTLRSCCCDFNRHISHTIRLSAATFFVALSAVRARRLSFLRLLVSIRLLLPCQWWNGWRNIHRKRQTNSLSHNHL